MNKNTLNSLVWGMQNTGGPLTHTTSFAFTGLWNRIVIAFLGQAPKKTKKQHRPSNEEQIAHAAYDVTERLFLSYVMRLAGKVGADDAVSRYDLTDMQLQAVTRWLRMGRNCGSNFCSEMREQERRWQVVDWLHEYSNDIWEEVKKKLPEAVGARAEWWGGKA